MGVWAPETVEAVAVYQLPVAEGVDTLPGGDTPPSDIGSNPNDSHFRSLGTPEFILRRYTIIGARLAQLAQ